MYFGGFLLLMMTNTLTAGLGRTISTSLYSRSFPLNRSETLPSSHSLNMTFCRPRIYEGRERTNVRLVYLMIYPHPGHNLVTSALNFKDIIL